MLRKTILASVFVVVGLLLIACQPQTIEVTRIVEGAAVEVTRVVEGEVQTIEVTRIVEGESETIEVTRIVEVEGAMVEVTPTPIGGQLTLYACLFDPDKLEVIFQTFKS